MIIQTTTRSRKAQDICLEDNTAPGPLEGRRPAAHLTDNVAEIISRLTWAYHVSNKIETRDFNSKVLNGKLQTEMRGICGHCMGGVLYPGVANFKTGRLVMYVMREEHLALRDRKQERKLLHLVLVKAY